MLMASPGELVKTVAEALGLPEPTVIVHDRNLVAAGLRTKSGRGWSAAKVTPRDAAHLLTAILGSSQVKESVRAVRRYNDTRPSDGPKAAKALAEIGIIELKQLKKGHSFVDALEALIASAASGSLVEATYGKSPRKPIHSDGAPIIEVAATSPGTLGDIRVAGTASEKTAAVTYDLPNPWDNDDVPPDTELDAWENRIRSQAVDTDLEEVRRISGKTIMRLGELLSPVQGGE